MAGNNYNAEDIKILEGLDAVRLRPGMYIGSTGQKGLHHILWEIVDNSIDEASNGYANKIDVILYADGSASVEDNGRGIPTDIHPKSGVSGVEVVFTKLHAGGKFDEHNYSFSGGLHGVGASVTNALSEWLKVEVYNQYVYSIEFYSYFDEAENKIISGKPKAPLINTKVKTDKKGSFVRFLPDKKVFESTNFNFDIVSKRLKELAFLNKGLEINFTDERKEKPVRVSYKFDGGLVDFAEYLNEDKNTLYSPALYYQTVKEGILIEYTLQHTDSYSESIFSYVNNIPTGEGGFHETGFKSGLTKALNDYGRSSGKIKEKELNYMGEDFREGLTAIISIKMKNVQFEGQTKTKLGNPEARQPLENAIVEGIEQLIKDKKNNVIFENIMEKAAGAAKVRLAARHAKDVARAKNSIDNANLIGKLSACTGRKAEQNELFIVEGDSAGGTAKQARIRHFQSILPLRGKPLNVEKKRIDQVLANEEIRTIISALGAGVGSDFTIDDLKYHKVIILSDADQDGAHIRAILLTFFFRYMRELINNGFVYIGMPPLYKIYKKDIVEYAYDDSELSSKIEKVGKGYQIQRYKGLGEMSADQLWDTTMNPESRSLMQVTIDDAAEAEKMITTLMGDRIEPRKLYIALNANFNKVDTFISKANI